MDFDFSDEHKQLQQEARRFLVEHACSRRVRTVLDGPAAYDTALWRALGTMGFLGVVIPQEYGGTGAGYLHLCVLAEEVGRALAPVPMSSSIYLAAEFILSAGSEEQKRKYLPKLASGEWIGTFAFAEKPGVVSPQSITTTLSSGRLTGTKRPVPDGDIAAFAIVAARAAADPGESGVSLFVDDLRAVGVARAGLQTIDPTRSQAVIEFSSAAAEPLGRAGDGWRVLTQVVDKAAVLTAFEQVGGADRALQMARDYALDRFAFGRPIGSFQAVKHLLADMYVSASLARSNAYYAAWALATGAAALPVAAATARVSATQAFLHCAKNNIQVHGGTGFTWESDCHLFHRRANLLAVSLGGLSHWEDQLIERMRARPAP